MHIKRPFLLVVVSLIPMLAEAAAVLFIHPTLVMFEGNDRSATITLTNRGDERGTFEMSWSNMTMTPDGGLVRYEGDAPWSVQSYVRYSPRRVTLDPLESQVIRIAVRRNLDAPEGEYYSHFRVLTLNSEDPSAQSGESGEEEAAAITIDARSAVAIPIIWRNSSNGSSASIEAVRVDPEANRLRVDVRRHGNLSVRGYLQVIEAGPDGTLNSLAEPVPLVIYPNLDGRTMSIELNDGVLAANLKPGTEVLYSPELEISDTSITIDTHTIVP